MPPIITNREKEVLHLIAHEYSTNEIANHLYISAYTVHSHRKNLLHKMDVRNTAGLIRKAFELGFMNISHNY